MMEKVGNRRLNERLEAHLADWSNAPSSMNVPRKLTPSATPTLRQAFIRVLSFIIHTLPSCLPSHIHTYMHTYIHNIHNIHNIHIKPHVVMSNVGSGKICDQTIFKTHASFGRTIFHYR